MLITVFSPRRPYQACGEIEESVWGLRGKRGKERSQREKTANESSKGDGKEHFNKKPKVVDGGERPFAMKVRTHRLRR